MQPNKMWLHEVRLARYGLARMVRDRLGREMNQSRP